MADTVREVLLLAVRELGGSCTPSDLIHRAYELAPDVMGLKGYEETHVDARKYQATLYGKKGMLAKGELILDGEELRIGPGAPRVVAMRSPAKRRERRAKAGELAHRRCLERAQASRAWQLTAAGKKDAITFVEACAFWGLPREVRGGTIGPAIAAMDDQLADRDESPEVRALGGLHGFLVEKFERQIRLRDSVNGKGVTRD